MKAFSFNNVSLLVQGQEITGWSDGDDVIIADRLNDTASHVIGVDGNMTMSLSNDRSGTLVFKLRQNSESNELLSTLITTQENGVFIPVFVQCRNTEGGELISGTQGYIMKPAKVQFGQNLQPVEWTIVVERLDIINAGSESL